MAWQKSFDESLNVTVLVRILYETDPNNFFYFLFSKLTILIEFD